MRGMPIGSQASLAPMLTALLLCTMPSAFIKLLAVSSQYYHVYHATVQRGSLQYCILYHRLFIEKTWRRDNSNCLLLAIFGAYPNSCSTLKMSQLRVIPPPFRSSQESLPDMWRTFPRSTKKCVANYAETGDPHSFAACACCRTQCHLRVKMRMRAEQSHFRVASPAKHPWVDSYFCLQSHARPNIILLLGHGWITAFTNLTCMEELETKNPHKNQKPNKQKNKPQNKTK